MAVDVDTPTRKRCASCGEVLAVEAFTVNRRRPDGREPYCRACLATRRREDRARRPEELRAGSRRRVGAYRRTAKGEAARLRAKAAERARPRTTEARLRQNARLRFGALVRRGAVVRPTECERCERPCRPEAHHHLGYSGPYWCDVLWLCVACHGEAHQWR